MAFKKSLGVPNLGLLGFHPNQRYNEIKVGKNSKSTRKVGNSPFEGGFMVNDKQLS